MESQRVRHNWGTEHTCMQSCTTGMQTGAITMENGMEVPLKTKKESYHVIQQSSPGHTSGKNSHWKIYMYLNAHREKEMAPHSSVLAWRILWTEEPGGLPSMGSRRVGHNWGDLACMHALEKAMAIHSSVLAWRIPGMAEPGGLPSMGSHRVRHDWSDLAAAAAVNGHCSTFYNSQDMNAT